MGCRPSTWTSRPWAPTKPGVDVATNLWDWLAFMLLRFQLEARPALGPLVGGYDLFYNTALADRSDVGPFYRQIVVARTAGPPSTAPCPSRPPTPACFSGRGVGRRRSSPPDPPEVTRQDTVPRLDDLRAGRGPPGALDRTAATAQAQLDADARPQLEPGRGHRPAPAATDRTGRCRRRHTRRLRSLAPVEPADVRTRRGLTAPADGLCHAGRRRQDPDGVPHRPPADATVTAVLVVRGRQRGPHRAGRAGKNGRSSSRYATDTHVVRVGLERPATTARRSLGSPLRRELNRGEDRPRGRPRRGCRRNGGPVARATTRRAPPSRPLTSGDVSSDPDQLVEGPLHVSVSGQHTGVVAFDGLREAPCR